MKQKNKEKPLKIIAVTSIFIGLLLLLVNYDNFEHGNSYLFVAIAGTIIGLLGLAAGTSKFCLEKYFFMFIKWFCSVGLFMLFSYWLVDKNILLNPAIAFFGLFWISTLIYLKRRQPKKIQRTFKLAIKQDLPIIAVFGVAIAIVCSIPFESKLNIVMSPNLSGEASLDNENYSINIKGGFIYRVNKAGLNQPEEVIVKQVAPKAAISFYVKTKAKLRLNVLNTPANYEINLNNEPIVVSPYLSGESLRLNLENDKLTEDEALYSKEYTGSRKGVWTDITLNPGINEVNISPVSTKNPLTFYVASDLHSGSSIYFPELIKMIKNNPDFIILNGDVVNYGVKPEYVVAGGMTEMSPVPIYTTIGNHELWQSGVEYYLDYFGSRTNSFTHKDALFIFLDSSSGFISDEQLDWLAGTLGSSDAKFKFVFSHIPPLNPVTGEYDDNVYPNRELRLSLFDKVNSEKLIKVLTENGTDVFFGAHTHVYGTYKIGDTTFVNTGALGGTVSSGDDVNYLKVSANNYIDIEKVEVKSLQQVADSEFENKIHMIRIFAGPFLLDKAIRFNLVILLILFADFVIEINRFKKLGVTK